ncbi:MAG: hypothetical protein ABGW69_01055 [Nanoarchaeota archaeon]
MKNIKKSVEEAQEIFKYVFWVVLVVFTLFLGYKIINLIINFLEEKKMIDIKDKINNYLELEDNEPFLINFQGIKYICFSNSVNEKKLKQLGVNLSYDYSILKNIKDNETLKYLIKNGQAPLIIILPDGSWKKFYVKDLLISPNPVPLCFKNGDLIVVYEKMGFKSIKKFEGN